MQFDFRLWAQKLRHFFSGKRGYVALGIFVIFLFLLLFRGCSSSAMHHRGSYSLARGDRFDNVNLMGKERNLAAFLDELLTSIAVAEKVRFRISVTASSHLMPNLESGQVDGI